MTIRQIMVTAGKLNQYYRLHTNASHSSHTERQYVMKKHPSKFQVINQFNRIVGIYLVCAYDVKPKFNAKQKMKNE